MKHFSKRLLDLEYEVSEVKRWKTKQSNETKNSTVESESTSWSAVYLFTGLIISVAWVGVLRGMLDKREQLEGLYRGPGPALEPIPWGPLSIPFLIAACLILTGIVTSIREVNRDNEAKRNQTAKLETDPLYRQTQLIEEALQDYRKHCNRYVAWYDAVDEGLREPDEELAERYYAFIVKAHDGIAKATENLKATIRLKEGQDAFKARHRHLETEAESTALTELLDRLDEPISAPRVRILDEPCALLEQEDAMAEVNALLDDEVLVAQVDAATRTH
ncbi:MAG: hypothetical protein ABIK13_00760 [Patescibacteria group bacterium]